MRAGWTGAALIALACAPHAEPAAPAGAFTPAVPAPTDCNRTEESGEQARYWWNLGASQVTRAQAGEPGAYEAARESLAHCIELDRKRAPCYHLLGVANEWTGRPREAAAAYSTALQIDPSLGDSYAPLAEVYASFRLDAAADQVLNEGERVLAQSPEQKEQRVAIAVLMAKLAPRQGKSPITALERAYQLGGAEHPELSFELGMAYALDAVPRNAKALTLLTEFMKRVCNGRSAKDWVRQCRKATSLMARLGP